jgi:hypothetical protein
MIRPRRPLIRNPQSAIRNWKSAIRNSLWLLALLSLAAPALAGPPEEGPDLARLVVGSSDLRVVSDAIVRREGRWVLVGVLVNNGDQAYTDITVRFGLYNSVGERVGDIEAQVERLEPGRRAAFRTAVYVSQSPVTTTYQSGASQATPDTANPGAPAAATVTTTLSLYYRPDVIIAIGESAGEGAEEKRAGHREERAPARKLADIRPTPHR